MPHGLSLGLDAVRYSLDLVGNPIRNHYFFWAWMPVHQETLTKKKNETSQEPWLALLYRRKAPRAPVNPRIRARVASTRSRCANQQVDALFSPGNTHIDPPPLTPIAKSHLTEI